MKTFRVFIGWGIVACTAFLVVSAGQSATDKDLQQKTSTQLRGIATTLRVEVAAGKAALEKVRTDAENMEDWGVAQWEGRESERKRADKAEARNWNFFFGGMACGILVGSVVVALIRRAPSAPSYSVVHPWGVEETSEGLVLRRPVVEGQTLPEPAPVAPAPEKEPATPKKSPKKKRRKKSRPAFGLGSKMPPRPRPPGRLLKGEGFEK